MAARVVWFLLWPLLFVAGGLAYLTVLLTCADDGPADYGDEAAIEFCRWLSDGELRLLASSCFIPFVVLIGGIVLWSRPQRLQ